MLLIKRYYVIMTCKSLGIASYFNIFALGNHIQSNTNAECRVSVAGNAI